MEPIELAPESVEAIARRVAELLASERTRGARVAPAPLLPIALTRKSEQKSRGRRRDDLAKGVQGTPFRHPH